MKPTDAKLFWPKWMSKQGLQPSFMYSMHCGSHFSLIFEEPKRRNSSKLLLSIFSLTSAVL